MRCYNVHGTFNYQLKDDYGSCLFPRPNLSVKHSIKSFYPFFLHIIPKQPDRQMMVVSVTGVFREKNTGLVSERHTLRSFHRTMFIVRFGAGFCIKNDMLHVNIATSAQLRSTQFKPIEAVPVPSNQVAAPIQAPTPLPANALMPDESTKIQMIAALAQQTLMNNEWSQQYVNILSLFVERFLLHELAA